MPSSAGAFLLDTNIVSELRKGTRADVGVAEWFEELEDDQVFLSVLTIGELRRGIEAIRPRDHRQARRLDLWLQELLSSFADRILPIGLEIGDTWGRLNVPDPLPVVDGLLAATAHVHGLTLATRDTGPAQISGISYVDPFQGNSRRR